MGTVADDVDVSCSEPCSFPEQGARGGGPRLGAPRGGQTLASAPRGPFPWLPRCPRPSETSSSSDVTSL